MDTVIANGIVIETYGIRGAYGSGDLPALSGTGINAVRVRRPVPEMVRGQFWAEVWLFGRPILSTSYRLGASCGVQGKYPDEVKLSIDYVLVEQPVIEGVIPPGGIVFPGLTVFFRCDEMVMKDGVLTQVQGPYKGEHICNVGITGYERQFFGKPKPRYASIQFSYTVS